MIVLGLILLIIGYLLGLVLVETLGLLLLVVGVLLMLLGTAGPWGGRWY